MKQGRQCTDASMRRPGIPVTRTNGFGKRGTQYGSKFAGGSAIKPETYWCLITVWDHSSSGYTTRLMPLLSQACKSVFASSFSALGGYLRRLLVMGNWVYRLTCFGVDLIGAYLSLSAA